MNFLSSVKDCINYFKRSEYKNLFDDECYRRLNNVLKQYGQLETHETILEVCLSNDDRTCDYSIRLDKKSKFGKEFLMLSRIMILSLAAFLTCSELTT